MDRKTGPLALSVAFVVLACKPTESSSVAALRTGDLSNPQAERVDAMEDLDDLCGAPDVPDRKIGRMQRLPYLQQVATTSAKVMFTAAMAKSPHVVVKTPEGLVVAQAEAARDHRAKPVGAQQFMARVTELEPSTVYCYSIEDEGGLLYGPAGFRTAADAGSLRFAVWGDSGDGSDSQKTLAKQIGTVPVDFFLHVGDIAYEEGRLFEFERHYFDIYADLLPHFAMFPVPGNHEYKTPDARGFHEVFDLPGDEGFYTFEWGDAHFVAVDTERLSSRTAGWVDRALSKSEKEWNIVFLHTSPYSSGRGHGSDTRARDFLEPAFRRNEVDLVFSGHDHHYERTKDIGGVHYIVTGGGGAETYGVDDNSYTAFAEPVVHFVYVQIADGRLSAHAIDASGEEFDQLVLEH